MLIVYDRQEDLQYGLGRMSLDIHNDVNAPGDVSGFHTATVKIIIRHGALGQT